MLPGQLTPQRSRHTIPYNNIDRKIPSQIYQVKKTNYSHIQTRVPATSIGNTPQPTSNTTTTTTSKNTKAAYVSGDDFRHPLDQQNTSLLRAFPGLEVIARNMVGSSFPLHCCLYHTLLASHKHIHPIAAHEPTRRTDPSHGKYLLFSFGWSRSTF